MAFGGARALAWRCIEPERAREMYTSAAPAPEPRPLMISFIFKNICFCMFIPACVGAGVIAVGAWRPAVRGRSHARLIKVCSLVYLTFKFIVSSSARVYISPSRCKRSVCEPGQKSNMIHPRHRDLDRRRVGACVGDVPSASGSEGTCTSAAPRPYPHPLMISFIIINFGLGMRMDDGWRAHL